MNLKVWKYIIVTGITIILITVIMVILNSALMGYGILFAIPVFLVGLGILIIFGLWDIFQYWRNKNTSGVNQELESRFQKSHKVSVVIGSVFLVLGGILPSYSYFSQTFGTRLYGGDFPEGGIISSGAGILLIILILLRRGRIGTVIPEAAIVLSGFTFLFELYRYYKKNWRDSFSLSVGMILTVVGVVMLLWAGFGILSFQRK